MTAAGELTAALVAIDSVNPSLVPGGAGEAEIAAYVAGWLRDAGLEVAVEEALPGRPNVVGTVRGRGGGPSLMLNAHTDTVGVAGMADPLTPRVAGNRLYARASYDMKAGLAASMAVAGAAVGRGWRGNLILTAVADEEHASLGAAAVVERWRADAAIVTEPTGLDLSITHKGFNGQAIETAGGAAHGSRPDLGVDAIAKIGAILVALEAHDRDLRAGAGHPLVGTG